MMCFRNEHKDIVDCKYKLKRLKPLRDPNSIQEYKDVLSSLQTLEDQKEAFWRQWEKQYWLQHGDANTKYFHQFSSARKQKNSFKQLKDESGMLLNWYSRLQAHIYKYFNDLFSSHGCEADLVLSKVRKMVSSSHNEDLL